jgi:predicted DNA repair protein MutK
VVGLVGGDVAFVAVDVLRLGVRPTRLLVHVWDVAAGERLELLVMVPEAFIGFS